MAARVSAFTRGRLAVALGLLVLVASVACGSTEPTATPIEQTTFADSLKINLAQYTRLSSGMYLRDSVAGTGATLASGKKVTVRYTGFFPGGKVFDSKLSPESITFQLGAGAVIAGWDEGIPGMKVGGKRMLIIPPELGYGATGRGPVPPYAVMLFLVEAVGVQ